MKSSTTSPSLNLNTTHHTHISLELATPDLSTNDDGFGDLFFVSQPWVQETRISPPSPCEKNLRRMIVLFVVLDKSERGEDVVMQNHWRVQCCYRRTGERRAGNSLDILTFLLPNEREKKKLPEPTPSLRFFLKVAPSWKKGMKCVLTVWAHQIKVWNTMKKMTHRSNISTWIQR